eukprot:CAMPEP_0184560304 /NCGR_PEP_ID=MMETSP0199_2-20130426/46868_1 /TAXON_ID=1112570 /ORGANISM="Thraustochytrium sp., Strain LLF1b" /LENGTH=98 /DNA_ID=CAMNT_0026957605 /DNA_START=777 /DNA_END=1073 /DNA_ORIENTATION=-
MKQGKKKYQTKGIVSLCIPVVALLVNFVWLQSYYLRGKLVSTWLRAHQPCGGTVSGCRSSAGALLGRSLSRLAYVQREPRAHEVHNKHAIQSRVDAVG